MEDFRALGISFKNTPLEIREKTAMSQEQVQDFLLKLKDTFGVNEAIVVSTCNRTEIYYTGSQDLDDQIISLLSVVKSLSSEKLGKFFYRLATRQAIQHLFHVSLGLESQVLGDIQISNQIKRAYQTSADLNMAGPFLHRLMHTIFFAHKRVVQETRLQDGNASVASVAVELTKGF
ncbi:MAG: glutamyl-tRNA reductase, partial [Bacteroidota bacterium]